MKKMIIMLFMMFGIAQQVNAMSRPSYGKKPVGIQQLLNRHKKFLLHREQLKKELKAKKEIEKVKREIDEHDVLDIFVKINNNKFFAEINEDYNVELNKLAQEQEEALRDVQRLAYVVSPKISDADKALHIPVVIHQAKEQHGILVYWLDPIEHEKVIQGCNGDKIILNKTQKYLHDRMNELAKANEEAHKKIENKMTLFQTAEYQQQYIQKKGELLINRELKAMPSAGIAELIRKDKMNRE